MKRFSVMLFAVAALVAVPMVANGGEVWQATYAMPSDGGTLPAAQAVSRQTTAQLDCASEACFKLCASLTCTPDCAKDMVLPLEPSVIATSGGTGDGGTTYYGTTKHWRHTFEMAGSSYVNILPTAAADPVCKLRLVGKNK